MQQAEKLRAICPACGRKPAAKPQHLGKRVTCPACHQPFEVTSFDIPAEVLEIVPASLALEVCVLPLAADADSITLAVADPTALDVLDRVAFVVGRRVRCVAGPVAVVRAEIDRHYRQPHDNAVDDMLREFTAGAPVSADDQIEQALRKLRAVSDRPVFTLTEALDRAAELRRNLATPAAVADLHGKFGAAAVALFDAVIRTPRVFDCDPAQGSVSEREPAMSHFLMSASGAGEGEIRSPADAALRARLGSKIGVTDLTADDKAFFLRQLQREIGVPGLYAEYTKAILATIKENRDGVTLCEWFIAYVMYLCKRSRVKVAVVDSSENLLAHMHFSHGLAVHNRIVIGDKQHDALACFLDQCVEQSRAILPDKAI